MCEYVGGREGECRDWRLDACLERRLNIFASHADVRMAAEMPMMAQFRHGIASNGPRESQGNVANTRNTGFIVNVRGRAIVAEKMIDRFAHWIRRDRATVTESGSDGCLKTIYPWPTHKQTHLRTQFRQQTFHRVDGVAG